MEGGNGVSEANGIAHSPSGEQNVCSVHTKMKQPETFTDGARPRAPAVTRIISFVEFRSDLLDRGHPVRNRKTKKLFVPLPSVTKQFPKNFHNV